MAAKPKTAPLPSLSAMADELGQLEQEYAVAIAPLEMKLARIKALKSALVLACPVKAGEEWRVYGQRFGVRLSPCADQRRIDFKKLLKRIGAAAFAKFATCTLGALEKNVAADVIDEVVSTQPDGARRFSFFEKGAVGK